MDMEKHLMIQQASNTVRHVEESTGTRNILITYSRIRIACARIGKRKKELMLIECDIDLSIERKKEKH